MYIWNGFNIIGKSEENLRKMLDLIEKTINDILPRKGEFEFNLNEAHWFLLNEVEKMR